MGAPQLPRRMAVLPLLLLGITLAFSRLVSPEDSSVDYVAAVVEYAPTFLRHQATSSEALDTMFTNLDGYEKAIIKALDIDPALQIIVFPEDGLYGAYLINKNWSASYVEYIPDINNGVPNINPCLNETLADSSPVLNRISCLARKYNVVIVLDMGDKQSCEGDANCPPSGVYQFNTQVAISETGQLLAKYHKSHLYYEPEWDAGPQVPVYFDTSFGVRFGLFICFDIMFAEPQRALLERNGVKDIAYSSWWVNCPPYITATQTQQAWSRLFQANLLASNIGTNWYNSGSGLYSNGDAVQFFYNNGYQPETKILVGKITTTKYTPTSLQPQQPQQQLQQPQQRQYKQQQVATRFYIDANKHNFFDSKNWIVKTFEAVPGLTNSLSISASSFSCAASFSISSNSLSRSNQERQQTYDTYGLVALNGVYNGLYDAQICALMLCPGPVNNASCTQYAMQGTTNFDYFALKASFSSNAQQLAMAVGNNATLLPFNTYTVKPGSIEATSEVKNLSVTNVGIFAPLW